tara:strand:- start:1439 stop:3808 length:2370 start_codon:yes stop_codon:yes gene_type:complete
MPYSSKEHKESNINYINKDFSNIKNSLIQYAQSYFPNTYKDFNETSPGMMLIEMSAYVGDVLSFYIDQQYREMLLPLAEERRNIVNIANMLGYKSKPTSPAYVDLTFTQLVNSVTNAESKVDYATAGVFEKGLSITSTQDSNIIFETLEEVDFTISSSNDTDVVHSTAATGLTNQYKLTRTVKAVSGETKTKQFTATQPSKFMKFTLSDTNVIDIISCIDSNNNNWYEVEYLAQDKVPVDSVYYEDLGRISTGGATLGDAYLDEEGNLMSAAVPYSLSYIQTNKRFVVERNDDGTTSLRFGNGILRNGTSINSEFLDLEQLGVIIPGQSSNLSDAIDPLLGDDYETLGESPAQTTLTITYRVGGGLSSNIASGDLTSHTSPSAAVGAGSINSVTNNKPAIGGKGQDSVDEIRERSKAYFATQNRCVTKEDYEARLLNLPSKYGSIAKVFVTRGIPQDNTDNSNRVGRDEWSTALSDLGSHFDAYYSEVSNNSPGGFGQVALTLANVVTHMGADNFQSNASTVHNQLLNEMDYNSDGVVNATDYLSAMGINAAWSQHLTNAYSAYQTLTNLTPSNEQVIDGAPPVLIHILAYDRNKNLLGNPANNIANNLSADNNDGVPTILMQNINNYLAEYKILTDMIDIKDGYIINFGVEFDVIVHSYVNKQEVKLKCIQKIKDYFRIENMQFGQAIHISKLEYELMGIDGVRAIREVKLTQAIKGINLFRYSIDPASQDVIDESGAQGTVGYGYKYNFSHSWNDGESPGIIKPPHPNNPAVFELKNPNRNIVGVVN